MQERLYLNDGLGTFIKTTNSLPKVNCSGSCVKAGDFDRDGDLDLFIGGWIIPRNYTKPAKSYLLQNEGLIDGEPKFIEETRNFAPTLLEAGMVTDAVWTDLNQDNLLDLVIVGEWMPITILKNNGQEFEDATKPVSYTHLTLPTTPYV